MEAPDSLSQEYAFERWAADIRNGKWRHPLSDSEALEPVRKSRRLQEQQLRKQIPSTSTGSKGLDQLPSPSPSRTLDAGSSHQPTTPPNIDIRDRKRKAEAVAEDIQTQSQVSDEPHRRRPHTDNNSGGASASSDRIYHWIYKSRWPKRYFESDPMERPAPKRTRSSSSSSRQSDGDTAVPDGSDQRSRTSKSAPYAQRRYATLLALKNSYMNDSQAGILASGKNDCKSLLNTRQKLPSDSLFDDKCFLETCANLQDENEMRVVIDILRLIAPSAEGLAAQGMQKLKCLKEHTNAGWNESIPVEGPRPQPDYSVGFRFTAFSNDQISKLNRHLKQGIKTYFSATPEMYFPFLTSEVKCGEQALNIADRQNAHSMTVAIRGIVELYRQVGRAEELHRTVLGFSISHDHRQVRIYAHYPEIEGLTTKCYRHTLREFIITDDGGKERWTSYQFIRSVYDSFVPGHFHRIKTAIDQLPDPAVESFQSTQTTEDAESSQGMMATSVSSSQNAIFKKPAPPPRRGSVADFRAQFERQSQEAKRQGQELMGLLKQQTLSNASSEIAELRQQLEQQRQEAKQRENQLREESKQQLAREKEESKQRHVQLMEQNKKLITMLEQRLG